MLESSAECLKYMFLIIKDKGVNIFWLWTVIEYLNYLNNLTIYCVLRAVQLELGRFELCWRHAKRCWITPSVSSLSPFFSSPEGDLLSFQLFHISKIISSHRSYTLLILYELFATSLFSNVYYFYKLSYKDLAICMMC